MICQIESILLGILVFMLFFLEASPSQVVDKLAVDFHLLLKPCTHYNHHSSTQQIPTASRKLINEIKTERTRATPTESAQSPPTILKLDNNAKSVIINTSISTLKQSAARYLSTDQIVSDNRLSRIERVPHHRFEIPVNSLVEQLRAFRDFKAYIEQHLNQHLNQSKSMDPLQGKPSLRPVHTFILTSNASNIQPTNSSYPPYAYFDHKTFKTRLTWCDGESEHKHMEENEESHDTEALRLREAMRNRRLMFVGDSVTRYQYVALTSFLTHRTWPTDECVTNEHCSQGGWKEFFEKTTAANQGMELCDCYRDGCCGSDTVNENRKYFNPELNVTIWYFKWYGDTSLPHGHFHIENDIQPMACMPSNCSNKANSYNWIAHTAAEFMLKFSLIHRPDYVIFNTGLHKKFDGKSESSMHEGKYWREYYKDWQKVTSQGTKFIFKSTTLHFSDVLTDNRGIDLMALEMAAHGFWEYWDVATVIYDLYLVYRKLELPYYYYRDEEHEKLFTKEKAIE
jgi:hypothetical protein